MTQFETEEERLNRQAAEMDAAFQQASVEAALEADREKALRDVFATAAMQSEIGSMKKEGIPTNEGARLSLARISYQMADAMMKVRKT